MGRASLLICWERKPSLSPFIVSNSYSDSKTWNDNDSQLLIGWDKSYTYPPVRNVYGGGSAHNKTTPDSNPQWGL
jgi:hypothetical protein